MSDLRRLTTLAALAASVILVAAPAAQAAPRPYVTRSALPVPVVYDNDGDFDDTMALAYLAGEDRIGRVRLLAVTGEVDGAGVPGLIVAHTRCVLDRSGLADVPVAEGTAPGKVNIEPPELRLVAETIVEPAVAPCALGSVRSDAPTLLADQILASPTPVTIVTTGPLTNVAAALEIIAAQPGGLAHVAHVYSMLGAFQVPGGLCCTTTLLASGKQELNAWIDPPADQIVLDLVGDRWTFIPVDATNDVPITASAIASLKTDHSTPEASIVAKEASSPVFDLDTVEPAYFWDPLAAVVSVTQSAAIPGPATFASAHITFVTSGSNAGAIVTDASGPNVTYANGANTKLFLQQFQSGLDLK